MPSNKHINHLQNFCSEATQICREKKINGWMFYADGLEDSMFYLNRQFS